MPLETASNLATSRFELPKRRQLFIRSHNEAPFVCRAVRQQVQIVPRAYTLHQRGLIAGVSRLMYPKRFALPGLLTSRCALLYALFNGWTSCWRLLPAAAHVIEHCTAAQHESGKTYNLHYREGLIRLVR